MLYTGKSNGNRLEQSVYKKLQDSDMLSQLKADALMFHHVYSNLVILSKSNDLNKSAFDMQTHYLELKVFLEKVELNPQTAMRYDLFSHLRSDFMVMTRNVITVYIVYMSWLKKKFSLKHNGILIFYIH